MNIIDYQINESKLQGLIARAEDEGLTDIKIGMNDDTLKIIEAQYRKPNHDIECYLEYKKDKPSAYYMGYPIVIDKKFTIGEVKIFGLKKKRCTRITLYKDGSHKIERDATDIIGIWVE